MDRHAFNTLRQIALEQAGLVLGADKGPLLASRIAGRIRTLGCKDERAYAALLKAQPDGPESVEFLDAITTHFTRFFRERAHFDALSSLIRRKLQKGAGRLRLWSAGCSSGEEPWSIAMVVADAVQEAKVDWRVLATDLSPRMLQVAQRGSYSSAVAKQVPAPLRSVFLRRAQAPTEETLEVDGALKEKVAFRRLNLSRVPLPMDGPLDAIFCRNVMLYLDLDVRRRLVREFERLLAPDGVLYVGHAESLADLGTALRPARPSIYCRTETPPND